MMRYHDHHVAIISHEAVTLISPCGAEAGIIIWKSSMSQEVSLGPLELFL